MKNVVRHLLALTAGRRQPREEKLQQTHAICVFCRQSRRNSTRRRTAVVEEVGEHWQVRSLRSVPCRYPDRSAASVCFRVAHAGIRG